MLSAVIRSERDYSAFTVGTITDTSVVHPKKSSRTIFGSPQYSSAYTGYGPNCFTTFWTQLTYHFNGRTAQPLERTAAPGCDEPTSRCQTFPSMWTLGEDKPVQLCYGCLFKDSPLSFLKAQTISSTSDIVFQKLLGARGEVIGLDLPHSLVVEPFCLPFLCRVSKLGCGSS